MGLIGDPLPHGVEPNRPMIEKLIAHAVSQRILDEPPPLETLSTRAPSTSRLTTEQRLATRPLPLWQSYICMTIHGAAKGEDECG